MHDMSDEPKALNDSEPAATRENSRSDSKGTNAKQVTMMGLGLDPEAWWMRHSARGDWARGRYFQRFDLERGTPQVMDALWADGWRHFGTTFFRDYFNIHERRLVRVRRGAKTGVGSRSRHEAK